MTVTHLKNMRQIVADINADIAAAGGGGGISDGDKGDITVSGSGATWTIDNDVVTFAKMQNVATARILGRNTASTGDVEELDATTARTLIGAAASSHTHAQSDVTGLVSDLAAKAPLASPTFTGTVTLPAGQVVNGVTLSTAQGTSNFLRGDGSYAAPSGGAVNKGTATIDFGSFPGKSDASVTVTGQAGITTSNVVNVWLQPASTADHSADEHILETIKVVAGNIINGTGFTIYAINTNQMSEPLVPVSPSSFRSAATSVYGDAKGSVGGKGTRIYGQWNIGWMWA